MRHQAVEIAMRSKGPAVVTDSDGRIVYWNQAATEVFGRDWRQVAGQGFPEAVEGRDIFGNVISHDEERFQEMVQRGEGLHCYAIDTVAAGGARLRLAVSVVVVLGPGAADGRLLYELRPLQRRRKTDHVGADSRAGLGSGGEGVPNLTRRQVEIVRLLAEGKTPTEISRALGISHNTVRNHIQNVIERLRVHNRTAAVALAIRHRLV